MALSVQKDIHGPLWPLGLVTVAASGTPVNLMSVVDPSLNIWNPSTPTPGASGATTENIPEYTIAAQQLLIFACKSVAPIATNTGYTYILEKGTAGLGNKTDSGSVIAIISATGSVVIGSAASNRNVFNPYNLYVDADNSGDGVLVTLVVQ